jgi:hypothetical protein
MLAQPRLEHVSRAAGQDIASLPGPGVDQHGGVSVPAAQGEVISAEHPRHADLGQGKPQQHPQHGVPRERDSQARQQPGPGTAR